MIETTNYGHGTMLVQRRPWGFYVGGRALCVDGKVRALSRIAETADTFFSVPATVKVRGKSVAGYITTECLSGSSVYVDDSDPVVVKFRAYTYRKNGHMLAAEVQS